MSLLFDEKAEALFNILKHVLLSDTQRSMELRIKTDWSHDGHRI